MTYADKNSRGADETSGRSRWTLQHGERWLERGWYRTTARGLLWYWVLLYFLPTVLESACRHLTLLGRVSPTKVKSPVNWTWVISSQQLNRICISSTEKYLLPNSSWLTVQLTHFPMLLLAVSCCCHWWRRRQYRSCEFFSFFYHFARLVLLFLTIIGLLIIF